jgi:hypothetical protein
MQNSIIQQQQGYGTVGDNLDFYLSMLLPSFLVPPIVLRQTVLFSCVYGKAQRISFHCTGGIGILSFLRELQLTCDTIHSSLMDLRGQFDDFFFLLMASTFTWASSFSKASSSCLSFSTRSALDC